MAYKKILEQISKRLELKKTTAAEIRKNIDFISLQFIDILGLPKAVEVPASQLGKVMANSVMFDGSSIDGFARIDESDMCLFPDWSTLYLDPNEQSNYRIAKVICDAYTNREGEPDSAPSEACPRLNLKHNIAQVKKKFGFELKAGCEAEFFLFKNNLDERFLLRYHDNAHYFDLLPLDKGVELRREATIDFEKIMFEVEAEHHEVADSQHEIDFKYSDVLLLADRLVIFKALIKTLADKYGLIATFMPKPVANINGSGMHTSVSLWKDGKNLFYNEAKNDLSETARQFLAGVMEHAPALTAIANPTINSYKRLVPGFEAPTVIAYSYANRSPMIRIPKGRGSSTRLEIRSPDATANPYLLFAAILAAGTDGITRKLKCPEPVTCNVYEQSQEWRMKHNIKELPSFLTHSLTALEKDKVISGAFTLHILNKFIESKRAEVKEYQQQVHKWELEKYLMRY